MRPRIFIGSSGEAMDVCSALQQELDRDFDVTVWDQDVFRLTYDALDSLLVSLESSDAGVFVLRPDDVTESRGQSNPTARDNVVFELGMFIGRLGRDRSFILTPDKSPLHLPSDLTGITTAHYDAERIDRQPRAAVGAACSQIRQALKSTQLRTSPEPVFRVRLDRAMSRMSKDLEYLLGEHDAGYDRLAGLADWPETQSLKFARTSVLIEVGRIENYKAADARTATALAANEFFDDQCIFDSNSALGAFAKHHFGNDINDFIRRVKAELADVPSQRVPRTERHIDESYGIGKAIFLDKVQSDHKLILVSATTERTGVGLRAEPHFLYAALEGIVQTMNEHRLNSLVMPVLGAGHGGIPLPIAILFNLLAVRSILAEDIGRHLRQIQIVVFDGAAGEVTPEMMRRIIARAGPQ